VRRLRALVPAERGEAAALFGKVGGDDALEHLPAAIGHRSAGTGARARRIPELRLGFAIIGAAARAHLVGEPMSFAGADRS
jgi:hypothetical protein